MITPPYLNKGDKVAIVAPARAISFEELLPSIKLFQHWGLEVVLGIHVLSRENQFAGSDEKRRADFQQALDDPTIKAILCARGGYGSVRILDGLDFSAFQNHPKWIIGYSDVTVFHSHINKHVKVETLHGVMPINIKTGKNTESTSQLKNILFGKKIFYKKPITLGSRSGLSKAELVGGNLSILYSLMGTPTEIDTKGKILFIEDLDEYLYHIDRMMQNLRRAGKLKHLKGLIVGGMTQMKDNEIPFGKTAQEIILEAVQPYHYPVYFDFPAGHGAENLPLILGREVTMIVDESLELGF